MEKRSDSKGNKGLIVGLTGAMAVGLVALSLGVPGQDGCGGEAELDSAQSEARGGGSTGGGGGSTGGGTTPLARAGYTTAVDPSVCEGNKSNTNNCNIYDKKTDVYMNGGPTAYALPANRLMYFTVLAPSAQNGGFIDAAAGNLSSNHDPYCNRLFKITDVGGVRDLVYPVPQSENPSCYNHVDTNADGTPDSYVYNQTPHVVATNTNGKIVQLFPYDNTPNPGGVYIMSICQVPDALASASAKDCKYDAFKVRDCVTTCTTTRKGESCTTTCGQDGNINVVKGKKFYDANRDGLWTVETFSDLNGNSLCEPAGEPFQDTVLADGSWTPAETFTDSNGNGRWDPAEAFEDKDGDRTWDRGERYTDANGNNKYDGAEPFTDRNGDGTWSAAESFTDLDADGVYDRPETFQDANGNGKCDVETLIPGWPIEFVKPDFSSVVLTDSTGFSVMIDPGTYTVSEMLSWSLPFVSLSQLTDAGEANVYPRVWARSSNPATYTGTEIELAAMNLEFGNVCVGPGGGHTAGGWSNANTTNDDTCQEANFAEVSDLVQLSQLPLVHVDATPLDFCTVGADGLVADPSTCVIANLNLNDRMNASNMAAQLSRQFAAMVLNTNHFGDTETRLGVPCAGVIRFPDPNAEVFAPGSQSADASGFAKLSSLLTEIENELRAHPCTTTGSACGSVAAVTSARAYQTALKNAVAAANEDRNFFIADFDPAVCPVPTTEELQAQRDGAAGAPVSL